MSQILIAESNHLQRALFLELLTTRGHSVLVAEDGVVARTFFDSLRDDVDLVIIRSHLFGLSGLDLLKHVRIHSSKAKILFMKESEDEVIIGLEIVDAILAKPFSNMEFLTAVQRCLA